MTDPQDNDSSFDEAAYAEMLDNTPDYVKHADTINVYNNGESFLEESKADEDKSDPGSFFQAALISGAVQLSNVPASLGNLFLPEEHEFEITKVQDVINSFDDAELSEYYEENQQSIDLVGFVASSLIPGIGGVKALSAGQAALRGAIEGGKVSGRMAKAFGLLAPNKAEAFRKVELAVANNKLAPSLLTRDSAKVLGASITQAGLESLAFETAIAASLSDSPVLDNYDASTFAENVLLGTAIFGLGTAAIDAFKLNSTLKRANDAQYQSAKPWSMITESAQAAPRSEKLALSYEDLHNTPIVPEGLDPSRKAYLERAAAQKVTNLENTQKTLFRELASDDDTVGLALHNLVKGYSRETQLGTVIGLEEISRVGQPSRLYRKEQIMTKRVAKGKATQEEMDEFLTYGVIYTEVRAWGDRAGDITAHPMPTTHIVDTLKKGESVDVSLTKGTVTAGGKVFEFNKDANYPTHYMKKANASIAKANANGVKLPPAALPKHFDVTKESTLAVSARYAYVAKMGDLAYIKENPLYVHVNDLPMLEKLVKEAPTPEQLEHVVIQGLTKSSQKILDKEGLRNLLVHQKLKIAKKKLSSKATEKLDLDEIAANVNVRPGLLTGVSKVDDLGSIHADDLFAYDYYAKEYTMRLVDRGARSIKDGMIDIHSTPKTLGLTYKIHAGEELVVGKAKLMNVGNKFVESNMALIKAQQKAYQSDLDIATRPVLGDMFDYLPEVGTKEIMDGAVPSGASHGLFTTPNGDYGTLASIVTWIGKVTHGAIVKHKSAVRESLTPILKKLADKPAAAMEWAVLNNNLRKYESKYVFRELPNDVGEVEAVLMNRATANYLDKLKDAKAKGTDTGKLAPPILPKGEPEVINIVNEETINVIKAHVEINGNNVRQLAAIRTSQKANFTRDPDAFYPIPVNPKDYPHYAIVKDRSITSGNDTSFLYASSDKELQEMLIKLKDNAHLDIKLADQITDKLKAEGVYEWEKALTDNYLNTAMKRRGVSSSYLVPTDPKKIVDDMLNWHLERSSGLVREAVAAKYEVAFKELHQMGKDANLFKTSKFGSFTKRQREVDNPFAEYYKSALAIRADDNYPWWVTTNALADEKFSTMWNKVAEVWKNTSKGDTDYVKVNNILKSHGYKGAAYDEDMEIFANAGVDRGVLSAVVQKANSAIATLALRWDAINAANNTVSSAVLMAPEFKTLLKAIEAGDATGVNALNALVKIRIPETDKAMLSLSKLFAKSLKRFADNSPEGLARMSEYRKLGIVTSIMEEHKAALEGLSFTGKESIQAYSARVDKIIQGFRKAGDVGEKITGNKIAEEFNRFMAADMMKQITDIAVAQGLMTEKTAWSYVNTTVNRTQGNYLASQRPTAFQGPIGQAIGLFQTYQFNLMQQLLRHSSEGRGKAVAIMMGTQATIHGMNGLPAFDAINSTIANAEGNPENKDIFSEVYRATGKELGDWVMYGAGSNLLGLIHEDLKINLYTRGDINPRRITILPTQLSDVPAVSASGKFFGNLIHTAEALGDGGEVANTLIRGLEHNGVSRPLMGLGVTLSGLTNPQKISYSTTLSGNLVAGNDLVSLANVARIAGAKPMSEAKAMDAMYRYKTYAAKDTRDREVLGSALKTKIVSGSDISPEDIEDFASAYAEAGGKQANFSSWVRSLYRDANVAQANQLKRGLSTSHSKHMQVIMGGELQDFSELVPVSEAPESEIPESP